ncbi:MAG: hypothetical protein IJP29_05055 [Lachnospiraceae bacterium]|nr:hypothetical protein [Lachnospiraceae bacterium]
MVELFQQDERKTYAQSSKGNQLKWYNQDIWYKTDYTGYEGLSEYVISKLLQYSDLGSLEYVDYEVEMMRYRDTIYRGCKSKDFLPKGWRIITLERLFQSAYGNSLSQSLYSITDYENRLRFLVDQTVRVTGLRNFGVYMSKLLTIDALFLNEDRHTHNIAVLMDDMGEYHYCPFFDHGASLLADTTMDYPLQADVGLDELIGRVEAKTFCSSFDEQLDIAEKLYGKHLHFYFTRKDVEHLLEMETEYPVEEKRRVLDVVMAQRRKYEYLF